MTERAQAAVNDALADLLRCSPKARRAVIGELRIAALLLCEHEDEQEAAAAACELLQAIESATSTAVIAIEAVDRA